MTTDPEPLLAMTIGDVEFALEPGREYRVGAGADCDVRLGGSERPLLARLRVHAGACVVEPSGTAPIAALRPGDTLRLHGVDLRVHEDRSGAPILADPRLRRARAEAGVRDRARAALGADSATFADMMARELRRAPWLSVSLLCHALLLLLLWLLFPAPERGERLAVRFGFTAGLGADAAPGRLPGPPAVVVEREVAPPELAPLPDDGQDDDGDQPAAVPLPDDPRATLLRIGAVRVQQRRPGARADGGDGDVLDSGGNADDGAFRRAVLDTRRTGLDVVLVVDSTGSMGDYIAATRQGLADMLEALRALVPSARFGVVAYRDRGRREDYLVRELPLTADFYAAVNFVQSVAADGGGDVPEAVLDGLRAAFRQPFRPGARRVVVLAGDAPPHEQEEQALLNMVRTFAAQPGSCVHALVTGRAATGEDPTPAFERIAARGGGLCCPADAHDRVLQQVLALTFGREFDQSLDAVRERVQQRRASPPTWALHLARSGGPELERALCDAAVAPPLIDALLRRPRRAVALELADLLGSEALPAPGRQAIAHVLQRHAGLELPPVEPERPRPLAPHLLADLRQRLERLLSD